MPKIPDSVREQCRALLLKSLVSGSKEVDSESKIKGGRIKVFRAFADKVEELTNKGWACQGSIRHYRDRIVQQSHALALCGSHILASIKPEVFSEIDWADVDLITKKWPFLLGETQDKGWCPITHAEMKEADVAEEGEFCVIGVDDAAAEFEKHIPNILGLTAEQLSQTVVKCPRCGSPEVSSTTGQTRSADEGQTATFKCRKCGKGWKQS